jgi:hypothetical protein
MKIYIFCSISFTLLFVGIFSCGSREPELQIPKTLQKPTIERVEITGALMLVSGSIMVLVTDDTEYFQRTILIPANDSIKEIVNCSYENRIDNGCRITLTPWISLSGNYLRNDSFQQILKFNEIQIIDDGSSCSIFSEE